MCVGVLLMRPFVAAPGRVGYEALELFSYYQELQLLYRDLNDKGNFVGCSQQRFVSIHLAAISIDISFS
jgi:hypothetical protein